MLSGALYSLGCLPKPCFQIFVTLWLFFSAGHKSIMRFLDSVVNVFSAFEGTISNLHDCACDISSCSVCTWSLWWCGVRFAIAVSYFRLFIKCVHMQLVVVWGLILCPAKSAEHTGFLPVSGTSSICSFTSVFPLDITCVSFLCLIALVGASSTVWNEMHFFSSCSWSWGGGVSLLQWNCWL